MANAVFEAARTVLAIREYEDRPVPEEVLHRIVEAGRLSASARNGQPWHFILVRERVSDNPHPTSHFGQARAARRLRRPAVLGR
jgi:nitroreductase